MALLRVCLGMNLSVQAGYGQTHRKERGNGTSPKNREGTRPSSEPRPLQNLKSYRDSRENQTLGSPAFLFLVSRLQLASSALLLLPASRRLSTAVRAILLSRSSLSLPLSLSLIRAGATRSSWVARHWEPCEPYRRTPHTRSSDTPIG